MCFCCCIWFDGLGDLYAAYTNAACVCICINSLLTIYRENDFGTTSLINIRFHFAKCIRIPTWERQNNFFICLVFVFRVHLVHTSRYFFLNFLLNGWCGCTFLIHKCVYLLSPILLLLLFHLPGFTVKVTCHYRVNCSEFIIFTIHICKKVTKMRINFIAIFFALVTLDVRRFAFFIPNKNIEIDWKP